MAGNEKVCDIFPQYVTIMNDYLTHFTSSKKYLKKDKDGDYLLLNGLSTLTHVFKITLNHADLPKAIENTEKAIFYYIQFIEQMEENIMYDLNVSSNNASLFVYKKTIHHFIPAIHVPRTETLKNLDYAIQSYRSRLEELMRTGDTPVSPHWHK